LIRINSDIKNWLPRSRTAVCFAYPGCTLAVCSGFEHITTVGFGSRVEQYAAAQVARPTRQIAGKG
jgi:hypothetical protein